MSLNLVADTEAMRDNWLKEIKKLIVDYDKNIKVIKLRVNDVDPVQPEISSRDRRNKRSSFFSSLSFRNSSVRTSPVAPIATATSLTAAAHTNNAVDDPHTCVVKPSSPVAASNEEPSSSAVVLSTPQPTLSSKTTLIPTSSPVPTSTSTSTPPAPESPTRWSEFLRLGESVVTEATVVKKNPMGIPFNRYVLTVFVTRAI